MQNGKGGWDLGERLRRIAVYKNPGLIDPQGTLPRSDSQISVHIEEAVEVPPSAPDQHAVTGAGMEKTYINQTHSPAPDGSAFPMVGSSETLVNIGVKPFLCMVKRVFTKGYFFEF